MTENHVCGYGSTPVIWHEKVHAKYILYKYVWLTTTDFVRDYKEVQQARGC